jgi:hypothetical protein
MRLALFNICIVNLAGKIANELGLSISHKRNDCDRFRDDLLTIENSLENGLQEVVEMFLKLQGGLNKWTM